jgi:hypothetical protein
MRRTDRLAATLNYKIQLTPSEINGTGRENRTYRSY